MSDEKANYGLGSELNSDALLDWERAAGTGLHLWYNDVNHVAAATKEEAEIQQPFSPDEIVAGWMGPYEWKKVDPDELVSVWCKAGTYEPGERNSGARIEMSAANWVRVRGAGYLCTDGEGL